MSINPEKSINVFAVGNALVDILALVPEDFIRKHQLNRGGMTLVDDEYQGSLISDLGNINLKLRSGGSAANTTIAIALSGGSAHFTGKVGSDANGSFYRQDMLDCGISFDVAPLTSGSTGSCLVLTTPDAERTMCTNLGVSTKLSSTDINVEMLIRSTYSYVEGYLWSAPDPRQACLETMEQSKRHGVKVAFTFSDGFLVEGFSDDFRHLITNYCDLVFCNAIEAQSLFHTESLLECAEKLGKMVKLALITDGDKGCLVVKDQQVIAVPGFPVKPLDTVGAGDAFAGGVLYGLTNGLNIIEAARWGNYLGSQIVQIYGPRLEGAMIDDVAKIVKS